MQGSDLRTAKIDEGRGTSCRREDPIPTATNCATASMCQRVIVLDESHEGAVHMQISTIGIDLAKNVFQVHGVDAADKPVLKKQLRRGQVIEFFAKLRR